MVESGGYPGNLSVPAETRERIVTTFHHALALYKAGKRDDAALGCEFILKLDPRFEPARQLLAALRDPNVRIDADAFAARTAPAPPAASPPAAAAPAPGASPAAPPDRILIEAIEAYAERRFDRAIELAEQVLRAQPANADAREILEKATRKRDLQPHVESFRQRILFAIEAGQAEEARLNFERMRGLDPDHPDVEALEKKIAALPPPSTAVPPPPPAAAAPPAPGPPVPPPPPNFFSPPPGDLDFHFDISSAAGGPPPVEPMKPPPRDTSPTAPETAPPPAFAPTFSLGGGAAAPPPTPAPAASPGEGLWEIPTSAPAAPPASPPAPAPETPAPAPRAPEVAQFLAQGDDLFARGQVQQAIETWSRVFLHDLNNPDAAERIARARSGQADTARKVAEAIRAGRTLYETGQPKEAREQFLAALALDEHDATARSFLQRIEEDLARPQSYDLSGLTRGKDVLAEEELSAELPAGPARAPAPSPQAPAASAAHGRLVPLLAALLIAAIAAGIFFLLRTRTAPSAPGETGATAIVEEARQLAAQGHADQARQLLEQIPATDPQYARARKLIASLTAPAPAPTGPAALPAGPAPTGPAAAPSSDAAAARARGEAALAQHRYIAAMEAFSQCAAAYANDAAFHEEVGQAQSAVTAIQPAVQLYNDGDYEAAEAMLWRLYQADHDNADVRSYLSRSYYNQGVVALQNSQFAAAAKSFGDALSVEPNDLLTARQKAFAQRYANKAPDLLARIYVKYLRSRP